MFIKTIKYYDIITAPAGVKIIIEGKSDDISILIANLNARPLTELCRCIMYLLYSPNV